MAFDPSAYVVPTAKPLPVVLLLDVSGSMSGAPITQLNEAVQQMIASFSNSETSEIEIQVSIITFGAQVRLHLPYTSASDIQFTPLIVDGMTPMGTALRMAKEMIEDKEVTPSRAYRPTVILVSDGGPNDSWEKPLADFINSGRSQKCDRMALAIGNGADMNVLNRFVEGCEFPVLTAENADQVREKFKFITMSVTARSQSQNPNLVPKAVEILSDTEHQSSSVSAQARAKSESVTPTASSVNPNYQPTSSRDDEDDDMF